MSIGVSVICMDHVNFESDVLLADELGVDWFHIDVMDGHFVPRYGIYPEICERIANISQTPMDVHLMVENVEFAVDQFGPIDGIKRINFHIDGNEANSFRIVDKIRSYGKTPGVFLNLGSPFAAAVRVIEGADLDAACFMGIHPGVLKQTARPDRLRRNVEMFMNMVNDAAITFVQADGGVRFDTFEVLRDAGVTNFVCGSSTLYKDTATLLDKHDAREAQIRANFEMIKQCTR